MTPAEKLARALEASREEFEAFHGRRKSKGAAYREALFARLPDDTYADPSVQRHWWTWQNARKALADWRSQQAGEVMRAPLPKGLAMLPGEIRAAIHAYAEDARQRGMDQAHALWELAKSSQEIEAAPKAPAMPDHVALAIDALKPHGNAHVRVLLAWLSSTGLTKA